MHFQTSIKRKIYLKGRIIVPSTSSKVASSLVLSSRNLEEALVSPAGSPGVLGEDVGNIGIELEANSQDTVVGVTTAALRVVNTSGVVKEVFLDVEGDGYGLLTDRLDQSVNVALNLDATLDSKLSLVGNRVIALLVFSDIRVLFLRVDVVIKDVVISKAHETSIASVVSIASRAVNKFLFRNVRNLNILVDGVSRLKSTCGGKSPTGTALRLVLRSANLFGSNPINLFDVIADAGNLSSRLLTFGISTNLWELNEILGLELSESHITELVDSQSVGLGRVSVVGVDLLESLREDLLSLGQLGSTGVLLAVLGLEHEELGGGVKRRHW